MAGKVEKRLAELGIELPDAPAPAANYVPFTMHNGMLIVSGQISKQGDGTMMTGKLGDSVDVAGGQAAARVCALAILAQAKAALGDLDRITQVLKLQGFVNATPDFTEHPQVINGASDVIAEILGDAGKHARAAVGMGSLPMDVSVEIDAMIAYE
ncbi:RidA family protein [Ahrensia sp. R2A130]|uniref:RidA family protein n=1 Tax=Ahrensia sp. R2A130 TaxID=744979 RepID=UPI0001E0BC1D|nr:RidA family protein [Ahrensia sp. R2A130]EFL90176.1 endoribonuclease L-PSP [Ahrensia sp. R2A130]